MNKTDKTWLSRYAFSDITVYMRNEKGTYTNLTDYTISDDNESICIKSNSEYVLMFCSYFYNAYKSKVACRVCDISLNGLLVLAGIGDMSFIRRFDDGCDKNESLLAILCARKITNYNYGVAMQDKENPMIYRFYRQFWEKDEETGRNRRYKGEVLAKEFYIA